MARTQKNKATAHHLGLLKVKHLLYIVILVIKFLSVVIDSLTESDPDVVGHLLLG